MKIFQNHEQWACIEIIVGVCRQKNYVEECSMLHIGHLVTLITLDYTPPFLSNIYILYNVVLLYALITLVRQFSLCIII